MEKEVQKEIMETLTDVGNDLPSADDMQNADALEQAAKELMIRDEELQVLTDMIPTLNFIELHSMKRDLTQTQFQLSDAKAMADAFYDSFRNMSATLSESENDTVSEIQKSDLEMKAKGALGAAGKDIDATDNMADTLKAIDHFYEEYDSTMEKIGNLSNLIESTLSEKYDDVEKTTSFLTQCTIEMIDKKLENVTGDETKPFIRDMKKLKEIFKNRTSTEWLESEIRQSEQAIRRLYYDIKKDQKNLKINSVIRSVTKEFMKYHSPEQMQECEKFLKSILGDELAFYMQYVMYSIHMRQVNRHCIEYKYIEMMIINCADIQMGIFDLEDESEYRDKIKALGDILINFIPDSGSKNLKPM